MKNLLTMAVLKVSGLGYERREKMKVASIRRCLEERICPVCQKDLQIITQKRPQEIMLGCTDCGFQIWENHRVATCIVLAKLEPFEKKREQEIREVLTKTTIVCDPLPAA